MKRAFKGNGILIPFLVIFIFLSVSSKNFFTLSNIIVVLRQAVFVAIMGFGMTFVISMGGIDLSVGAIFCISGTMIAQLVLGGTNIYLSILITMCFGIAIGIGNGLLIAKLKIADFIATLGMMSILRGVVMVWTLGIPVYGLRFPEIQFWGQGYVGPIPFAIILAVVLFFILFFLLYKTKLGRYTVSIGSNLDAARLVGIELHKVKIIVYGLCGFCCAVAGILQASRVEAAVADAGTGYEMDVIAATVLGGTSLSGGKGNLIGTAAGAVLMAMIRNGLNLLNVNTYWHQVVIGAFILVAVTIDNFTASRIANAKE